MATLTNVVSFFSVLKDNPEAVAVLGNLLDRIDPGWVFVVVFCYWLKRDRSLTCGASTVPGKQTKKGAPRSSPKKTKKPTKK